MDTVWLILLIIFLVISRGSKKQQMLNRKTAKKAEIQPLWDELRRMQQQLFPEGTHLPPISAAPLPDWLAEPLPEEETAAEGWSVGEAEGTWQAAALPAVQTMAAGGTGEKQAQTALEETVPAGSGHSGDFILQWQKNALLQGVIMAEILQPPGGKSRHPYFRK